jgi:hypothetical protein
MCFHHFALVPSDLSSSLCFESSPRMQDFLWVCVFGSFDSIARELLGTPSLVSFFRGKSGVWLLFHGKHRSPHRISLPLFSPSRADSGCDFLVCAGLRLGSSLRHFFLRSIMLRISLSQVLLPAGMCLHFLG